MIIDRRHFFTTTAGAFLASIAGTVPHPTAADDLPKLRFGMGTKSMNASTINMVIGEKLGFNREEGFSISPAPLGNSTSIFVGLDRGDLQFGVGAPSFQLPLFAKGELPPLVNFYEFTYPYKWDIAVLPDSEIHSYADLKGKKIGVSGFGTTDFPITKAVLRDIGIDSENEVSWIAVGEGVTAGVAIRRSVIDALAYFDTGFGQIESSGIVLRMLPRPDKLPMIGGFFIMSRRDYMEKNEKFVIGLGRSVRKASEFILTNPQAGAKILLEMYPELAPRGADQATGLKAVLAPVLRRMQLYRPPYPGLRMGEIDEAELRREAEFLGLQIGNLKPIYTNSYADPINQFDMEKVIALAKQYPS